MRPTQVALLVFAAVFALYLTSLAPGAYWGDSAQLQTATAHPTLRLGVRSYPLWSVLSWSLSSVTGLPPDVSANAFSALSGAVAVALCFLLVRRISGSGFRGLIAALTLAISHLLWSTSSAAEVYSLTMVFLLLLLLLLHGVAEGGKGCAFLLGIVLGLSLLHHRMVQAAAIVVLAPAFAGWMHQRVLFRVARPMFAGLLLGAAPFLAILLLVPGALAAQHALRDFLLGAFRPGVSTPWAFVRGLVSQSGYELRFLTYNLAGPQLLLAAAGLVVSFRQRIRMVMYLWGLLLLGLVLPVLFPQLGDRYVLLLPSVLALSVFAGLAPRRISYPFRRGVRALLLVLVVLAPVAVYYGIAHSELPLRFGLFSGRESRQARQFLWPPKRGEEDPERMVLRALEIVPPGATILGGWGEGNVFAYLQTVEGVRPDVETRMCFTAGQRREAIAGAGGPLFVTSYPLLHSRPDVPTGFTAHEVVPGLMWRLDSLHGNSR